MCFVVIVLGKAVYFFSPLPLSKSRLAVRVNTCVSSIFCLARQQVTSPPPRCHTVLGHDCPFCFAGDVPCHLAGQ